MSRSSMPVRKTPQFLIAAPSSNSGKTTITLGILRALTNRGIGAQSFKCGPDYIDPILHAKAAGRSCINLDTFMCSNNHVKELFATYSQNAEASIVEGVMGMFDGADKMKGSSAEIALLLDIPVIMVVNAKAMAYSAAALLYGFKNFFPEIKLPGVIFNNVKTESHYSFLQDACRDAGVEALGYLPPQEDIEIPDRHLGLSIASDINFDAICNKIAASLEKTVDIQRLLDLTARPLPSFKTPKPLHTLKPGFKIAVAHDEAFSFTYHENLEALRRIGDVVFFSPLTDRSIPPCDFLYLAGGYPELFLDRLSTNTSMLQSVSKFCENDGKVYSECGGMMYLGKSITASDGKVFDMVGFLPLRTSMESPKMRLGYRSVHIGDIHIKGHEFHYSTCIELEDVEALSCSVENARGANVDSKIYRKHSTTASYIHLYWGEDQKFLNNLMGLSF
ncbi:MAG: cobyrinate a,c-diamide synthase [Bacteroidota bacterium]